jgi:hypothetical protein
MPVSFYSSNISFCANKDGEQKRKDAEKKVVTGGGAVAATAAASNTKAAKSGFDMFNSSKKLTQGMQTVTTSARAANETVKKTTTLWSKVCENARWAKKSVLKWGDNLKNMRYIKPLIESAAFRGVAGFLGYGFGLITLISGCSDIAKVASDVADGKI